MAFITMWRRGVRQCILVVGLEQQSLYTLRIVDGVAVLRAETVDSADKAVLVANIWQTEEDESRFGSVPPA
jgi:hypothetical protein